MIITITYSYYYEVYHCYYYCYIINMKRFVYIILLSIHTMRMNISTSIINVRLGDTREGLRLQPLLLCGLEYTANLPTNIVDFRGLYSSITLT